MKIIPTRTHGYLDYIVAVLLIASPWIFDFDANGAETWIPVILGVGTLLYSLFTDYELGMLKRISMRAHLMLDLGAGILLAASPWLFGFSDYVWAPHLVIGIMEVLVSLMTDPHPANERDEHKGRKANATAARQTAR